jgi:hypothetical protein
MSSSDIKDVAAVIVLLIIIFVIGLFQRRPKPLNQEYFNNRWHELQKLLPDKKTWGMAVIDADKLLDEALRKRHYKGKTMGERLVSSQRDLTDNDGVWFGHKLRNRIVHETGVKLKKRDVTEALVGFRQALKDLGAL